MFEFLIASVFLLGLCMGSFANVFIYRWPRGESVVAPRSRCPGCQTPVKWYQNVPVLSWLALRGKCAKCRAPISVRYPIVELMMGLLFAAAAWRFGFTWKLVEALPFIFALVTASWIDLDHYLLPDIFTLSGIVIGLVGSLINPDRAFWPAFIGVFLGGGFLWSIAYFYSAIKGKEGLGGGDIKLLAWIGAVMGWSALPFVILVASVTGALVGSVVAMRSKEGFAKPIPFGPFLAGAALLYFFEVGSNWTQWYFELHGLDVPS